MNELFIEGNEYFITQDGSPYALGKYDSASVNTGDIFIGRVCEIIRGLSSAFVNIGDKRTAFLHDKNVMTSDYILCQVETAAHDTKGADVSLDISFSGKYVFICFSKNGPYKFEFSKKIEEFNKNLIKVPDISDYAPQIKVRTAFNGDFNALQDEIDQIFAKFAKILEEKADSVRNIYKCDLYEYLNRRYHIAEFDAVHKNHHLNFYQEYSRALDLKKKKIFLKSGGFIVVDKTEAMHVIDVNSGPSQKSALETNLEAAAAILGAIRVQNICGIIIVDFINMQKQDEDELLSNFKSMCANDYTFMKVLGFTRLGLLEIERKRN